MTKELAAEWKKNADLLSVVNSLRNDFPDLSFHMVRLLSVLKSIDC